MVDGELKPQMASDDEGGVGGRGGYCRRTECEKGRKDTLRGRKVVSLGGRRVTLRWRGISVRG